MRIVSLLPSATEIVCELGLTDALVGVSHDCDFPADVLGKPVLSEAIVAADQPSAAIDGRIRGEVHNGRSVYHLDATQLARLRPDLILTQELCTVCAPSAGLVQEAARGLATAPRILSLEPHSVRDILQTILLVGELTGTDARAEALVGKLRGRIDAVGTPAPGSRPRVVCLEWFDPLYVGGHWIPEMVAIAGGSDVLGRAGRPSVRVEWQAVLDADPEVLVLMPCGFDLARARAEAGLLTGRPGWGGIAAVREGRVYLTDASAYFNRPGPRIVHGLEILAAILHPGTVSGALPAAAVEPL